MKGEHSALVRPGGRRLVRVPVSTYRVQFHVAFGFRRAADIVPYLNRLGVTDFYASPYLMATPGSTHGYDICDHNRLNPALGDEHDYDAFCEALARHHMGQMVDFVPNHMGIDPKTNRWWHDVLENGPSSPFADFFDIDWEPVKPELHGKVLLPVLGDQYGVVLERGELRIVVENGALQLAYFDHRFPLNPRHTPDVFRPGVDELSARMGPDSPPVREFLSVLTALTNLPVSTERDPERVAERQREKEVARERFTRVLAESSDIRTFVEDRVRVVNGTPGESSSFDVLHDVLEAQAYRLAYWRTAADEINYRRFFDVNELACLRMEDSRVFDAAHALILKLIREGRVSALRIDHVDGLFNPREYLARLDSAVSAALTEGAAGAADGERPNAVYTLVEKILSGHETLVEDWPVEGTTGYELLNEISGVFVNGRNALGLRRVHARLTRRSVTPADEQYEGKKVIMLTSMSAELNVLTHALNRLSECDRRSRDFTLASLRRALREIVACFPVYRTYLEPSRIRAADLQTIQLAIDAARRRNPLIDASIFDFLRRNLLPVDEGAEVPVGDRVRFAMQFQQYTGPVQAKGLEDTAFYRQGTLLSVNEVGGDLARLGRLPADFHAANVHRARLWPLALSTTGTHDAKRGEDARARINVLSDMPEGWGRVVARWMRINASLRTPLDGQPAPDRNDEYLFYQTLVGMWPLELLGSATERAPDELVDRMRGYMAKAIREAKRHSSWLNADSGYEAATSRFVKAVLTGPTARRFLEDLVAFVTDLAPAGIVNSLAQVALKLTSPGVPDFYQGTETWDFSLVDPDNRRPVHFDGLAQSLDGLEPLLAASRGLTRESGAFLDEDLRAGAGELLENWPDGRVKMFVTACGLRLRRAHQPLFQWGRYIPLSADEEGERHLLAFAREWNGTSLLTIVPRNSRSLVQAGEIWPLGPGAWKTMRVILKNCPPVSSYHNLLTGDIVKPMTQDGETFVLAGQAFTSYPIALLFGSVR